MNIVSKADVELRSAISSDSWTVEAFLAEVAAAGPAFRPFDQTAVSFCEALSRQLIAASAMPQVVALGYWLRAASIARMEASFRRAESTNVILVPRGIAFHVTPANVDTVFIYSWVLSLLAGNANVVRLSSRSTDGRARVLDGVATVFTDSAFNRLRMRNKLVVTAHDDATSRALSAIADVRVIWGGNATVEHFRQFPLPFRGREITFPNRHSLAVLDAEAIRAASDEELASLADRFFNDAFWYDQGACSSPRLVLWSVTRSGLDSVHEGRRRFRMAVSAAIGRHGYEAQTGVAINKVTFALGRAAVSDGVRIETVSNEATWVLLPDLRAYDRDNCGGGLFFEFVSVDLASDMASLVNSDDQTAACYGLGGDEVRQLARDLNGRGIDRWVPIGRALEFGSVWDGYDMLSELTKRVVVDLPRGRSSGGTDGG